METIEHLFYECIYAKNLLFKICEWLSVTNIEIPVFSFEYIMFGVLPVCDKNELLNLIIIIYKLTLYKHKGEELEKLFIIFKNKLKEIKTTELKIASYNNNLAKFESKCKNKESLIE